jgi:phosphatidylserine/phosphatidylglycerophosphate/cardiolipin synthase-like enzyme
LPLHVAELLCAVRQPAYELLTEGDVYYARMLRAIRGARRHVQIMMYIWQNDRIGRLFLNALERKCRQGTQVTIVIDAIGSFRSAAHLFRAAAAIGSIGLYAPPLAGAQLAMVALPYSPQPP